MRRLSLSAIPFVLASLLPAVAAGTEAYTTGSVNERAGPDVTYPVILTLPPDAQVTLYGCVEDYGWCDVDYFGNRGWVFGTYLQVYYDGELVAVPEYAQVIQIPIVTFSFDYWDYYYRARPFYSD